MNIAAVKNRLLQKAEWEGACLEWTGSKDTYGYGTMMVDSVTHGTHRLAWIVANGPIPDGMLVDHTCHNPACIRIKHLRLATRKQNNENKAGTGKNNKSGFRGVCWDKRRDKWWAYARHNRKLYHAGYFSDVNEAGEAARQLRLKLFSFNTVDLT